MAKIKSANFKESKTELELKLLSISGGSEMDWITVTLSFKYGNFFPSVFTTNSG